MASARPSPIASATSTAPSIRSTRLQTGSGTCRDYALFMIEALRRLGIAARFVSGYLFIPGDSAHGYVGGGSTHAWVQVYLPSAGWIEFDPTNGIVGTRDLIRVAVARDPRQAIPLHGCYLGSADAYLGMEIGINVVSVGDDESEEPTDEQREEIAGETTASKSRFARQTICRSRLQEQSERRSLTMEIDVGFEISYKAAQPTPMVMMLSIHPSRSADIIGQEIIVAEPERADRLLPRQFWQCLRPAGGARRRRDLEGQGAGARFRIAGCGGAQTRSNCRSINCPTTSCSI